MAVFINIGFGNEINIDRVVSIISPDSAPARRMVQKARERDNLVDATQGRKTKSVITTDTQYVVISALQPETLAGRCRNRDGERGEVT